MAKSLIRNMIAGKNYGFTVFADGQTAATFADAALNGTYQVLKRQSESGNAKVDSAIEYVITGKNEAGLKTTFSFYAKSLVSKAC